MKLENQVTSLDMAKRLKELGVKQESLFIWFKRGEERSFELAYEESENWKVAYSAFTVAELGEMLPQIIKLKGVKYQLFISVGLDKQWFVVYANEEDYEDNAPFPIMMTHSEANARGKMVIYLLENKLITL